MFNEFDHVKFSTRMLTKWALEKNISIVDLCEPSNATKHWNHGENFICQVEQVRWTSRNTRSVADHDELPWSLSKVVFHWVLLLRKFQSGIYVLTHLCICT